jgi:hypothetical protein
MLTTAVSNNLAESRQINFRLWAGGHFTLRQPRSAGKPCMAFTLVDLKAQIAACPAGGAIGVPYELYSVLFQPGEPDEGGDAITLLRTLAEAMPALA